ncbi:hypothetical protein GCM10027059_12500 [Myceligenerans halotolerans]
MRISTTGRMTVALSFFAVAVLGSGLDLSQWFAEAGRGIPEGGGLVSAVAAWGAEHRPVLGYGLGALVAVMVVLRLWSWWPRARDPRRDYPGPVRREAFGRAGGRCEYTSIPGVRCRRAAEHADHLHPWSRGGATTLANAVASCARHNLVKSDRILAPSVIWALQQRRRRYFPPGADVRAGERYKA